MFTGFCIKKNLELNIKHENVFFFKYQGLIKSSVKRLVQKCALLCQKHTLNLIFFLFRDVATKKLKLSTKSTVIEVRFLFPSTHLNLLNFLVFLLWILMNHHQMHFHQVVLYQRKIHVFLHDFYACQSLFRVFHDHWK